MGHKGIIPSGLFSSTSDTARGWTVVEQIERDFSQQSEIVPSMRFPDSGRIFLKGDIAPPVEPIFNGIITNDKFWMSRLSRLYPMPARKAITEERKYPSEANHMEYSSQEETDETTAMEYPARHHCDT